MSGRGSVFSWVEVCHPLHPWFIHQLPLPVALVGLEDAPEVRFTTNILECPLEEVHIGMPVEVVFEQVTDKLTMPYFRPAR